MHSLVNKTLKHLLFLILIGETVGLVSLAPSGKKEGNVSLNGFLGHVL